MKIKIREKLKLKVFYILPTIELETINKIHGIPYCFILIIRFKIFKHCISFECNTISKLDKLLKEIK
jgi:hypothetical protein